MLFSELGLSEQILRAVAEQGYETPTPIQEQAIPVILQGRDVLAGAQTGTGKTAGFTLPLLQLLQQAPVRKKPRPIRVLILTPTRELALQVYESVCSYGKHLPFFAEAIFGGVSSKPQIQKLQRGTDIVVATPGRLLDLIQQGYADLSQIEYFVLDEADRMLDMGFIRDIRKIIQLLPARRQNLLFSATYSPEISTLAEQLLSDPVEIAVAKRNSAAETVSQLVYGIKRESKRELLAHLIGDGRWQQVLVFVRTKHGADRLCKQLIKDGIRCAALHGDKSQGARTRALDDFKSGAITALVATDIAARGLDIDQLPHVVNYDLPQVAEDYVHRIGRTGRAGAEGQAISLVDAEEAQLLAAIEKLLKKSIPRVADTGYEKVSLEPVSAKSQSKAKPKAAAKPRSQARPGDRPGERARGGRPPRAAAGGARGR
ncbi:DEAD/DEAH box helicase [Methylomonas sp. MED-D]|uniref:DEAD/DEAH box helicase n=1 Tax=unclassified Methylomonas TaxID=2608980 RepID=UPI0028A42136|nr:DEAD/DEAH box helicase [Methylomonas sp. MV1]MDT4329735.1 DEAD/DEAH box helicase [Methylomonas sp. MV1]